jgi:PAS domain S-box-containing protein
LLDPIESQLGPADGRLTYEDLQARQAQLERHERLIALLQHNPLAVIEWSSDFRIAGWSEGAARMFGWSAGERVGKRVDEPGWIHSEDRSRYEDLVTDLLGGQRTQSVSRIRNVRKDGAVLHCDWHNSALPDANGTRLSILSIVLDVSEHVWVEQALSQARDQATSLARFPEENPDPVLRVSSDLVLLYANRAARVALGVLLAEVGSPAAAALAEPARKAQETGRRLHREIVLDGRSFLMSFSPAGSEVNVYGHDITERTRAEQALRESEARFRLALKNAPVSVAVQDRDLRFLWAYNQRTADPAQITGRTDFDLFAPAAAARLVALKRRAMATGAEVREEMWIERDGRRMFLDVYIEPLCDPNGETSGVGVATVDLTQIKEAEEALRGSELALREADRAKDEFLAVLSHELRNPLAPIRHSLYILEHAAPGSDQARRAQTVIGRQVAQLSRLVDDLLDLTRINRNKIRIQREPVELNDLLRRTVEDHHAIFEQEDVGLELQLSPRPLVVEADPTRLAQAVGNLLANAAKFTARGGRTVLALGEDPQRREATVQVKDTGVGMRPETLQRLFVPFMQAETSLDRSRGGLGLGLVLVKGIVEMHGGSVSAASPGLGQGSEFVIRLPLAPQATVAEPRPGRARAGRTRHVLVIEDNEDAADSLCEVLRSGGHVVDVARGGDEGIAQARALRPDVVLCDLGLPGVDGYAVARALRAEESLRLIRLVALSGYALPEDVARARQAGFDTHLAKPADLEELERVLGE